MLSVVPQSIQSIVPKYAAARVQRTSDRHLQLTLSHSAVEQEAMALAMALMQNDVNFGVTFRC